LNPFQLISQNNGWAIAFTGVVIVLTGLAFLALVISQLHKIIDFFSGIKRVKPPKAHSLEGLAPQLNEAALEMNLINDPTYAERIYHSSDMEDAESGSDMVATQADILTNPGYAARIYRSLTERLGNEFQLSGLYTLFNEENIAHPHLTIRSLRDAGYLVRLEDGRFSWNFDKF
jgi:hypothetical protein